ncbi:MAG: ECF transporter S component [Clostridia bacterium]|nr:ECF transporter S component [Clostridia bacterium]
MQNKNKLFSLTLTAAFLAIIVVMAFTPIGYLKVGVIEITLMVLPVALGAVTVGTGAGAVLGLAFGATSFAQCFGMSPFGAALLSVSPVFTALTCFLPRLLLGVCAGLLFCALSKAKLPAAASCALTALCASLINTVGFVGLVVLLFGKTDYVQGIMETLGAKNLLTFAFAFAGVNSLVEAAANAVLGGALGSVLLKLKKRI